MELQGVADNRGTDIGAVTVCPVYTSVDVAQSDIKEYQDKYAHPGELDSPNEYDIVTEQQRKNETKSSDYLQHNNNVLYADQFAAQEMKHATLTRSEQSRYTGQSRYVGHTGGDIEEESGEKGCGFCEGRFCLWLSVTLMLVFISVVAIAALILALLMLLQVVPICNCAATPEQVQALIDRVQALENGNIVSRSNISSLAQRLETFDVVPAVESAISQRITDNGTILGLSFAATLKDFEPYSDCSTNMETTCVISDTGARCETPDLAYIMSNDPERNYTRDVRCEQLPLSTDQQHLSTTLLIQDNIVFCVCERIVVVPAVPLQQTSCGLTITRCRSSRDVAVEVVTMSNAQLGN